MANNQYVNRVDYGGNTIMDISDTTAEAGEVISGKVFYTKSGARTTGSLGNATQSTAGLMSAADKTKLDEILSQTEHIGVLVVDTSLITNATTSSSNAATVINAAIQSAKTNGLGTVIIPPGTYLINQTIYLEDNVMLKGSGMTNTTLKIATGYNIDCIRTDHPVNDSGISDLNIDGNKVDNYSTFSTGTEHGNAINVWLHRGIIERVRTNYIYKHALLLNYDVSSSTADGLNFDSEDEYRIGNLNVVRYCHFDNSNLEAIMWGWRTIDSWFCYNNIGSNAANLYLEGGSCRFIGNHFDGDADDGNGPEYNVFCPNGCNTVLFEGNIFENTKKHCIYFQQPSYNADASQSILFNNNIVRTGSRATDATYNLFEFSGYSASNLNHNITITGNTFLNPNLSGNKTKYGIHLAYTKDSIISNNSFYNIDSDPIKIESTCSNIVVTDNIYENGNDMNTATTTTAGLMSAADKTKLDGIDTSLYAPKASPVFTGSISLGRKANTTVGDSSFAIGNGVEASGTNSHAEGGGTTASGANSHAEGAGTNATNTQSHAEGAGTTASGAQSHAEGSSSTASGGCSHAEGSNNTASAGNSHVEGSFSLASGANSHAEGSGSIASNLDSHAEGSSKVFGQYAHGEGYSCFATGDMSHAEGILTIAMGTAEHVSGKCNVADSAVAWVANTSYAVGDKVSREESYVDASNETRTVTKIYICKTANSDSTFTSSKWQPSGQYLEIVGNGVDDSNRSNARALDWSGNERLMGDLYVGCSADSTGGTKLEPLPVITSSDNGKTLEVINGNWTTGKEKINKNYIMPLDGTVSYKVWTGLSDFYGCYVWTDGENIYHSYNSDHQVLNKSTSTWSTKTWTGLTSFYGYYVWTDGENIYYSEGDTQYILDKSTSTWSVKTWTGLTNFNGHYIWTDGENIYYSYGSNQYVLNKSTSTWTIKTWTGLTSFYGDNIWFDEENIYSSENNNNYVLNKSTSTWSTKTWTGLTNFYGSNVWSDGENIYYSYTGNNYILNKNTSTWITKTWDGLTSFYGSYIWSDGENIYYSYTDTTYVFNKDTSNRILLGQNGKFSPIPTNGMLLPTSPTTAGTYYLQCTVSNGTPTYSWVTIPAASGVSF